MPFKLRLEFPGATYHLINRGNYRRWIFETDRAKAAFEACLFAACERCEWLLQAFVIMGNHFHLAVPTPLGNLVSGMQWLESTFANRFNRFRDDRGHLFQGRYKALLVERGETLGHLCTYIDLNPVRAGIVSVEQLREYRFSSHWYLRHPAQRPTTLDLSASLAPLDLPDVAAGWDCYQELLAWHAAEGPAGKTPAYVSMARGWALGSDIFKNDLLAEHPLEAETRAWEIEGALAVRQRRWHDALRSGLSCIPLQQRQSQLKSAAWKIALAARLKNTTDVSNAWLAAQLDMGSHFYVSKHVGNLLHGRNPTAAHLLRHLEVKGKA